MAQRSRVRPRWCSVHLAVTSIRSDTHTQIPDIPRHSSWLGFGLSLLYNFTC